MLAPEIGRLIVGNAHTETDTGHERRRRHEVASALAETIDGRVNTEYSFKLENGKLVAEDGEAIEDLVDRGFRESVKMASRDSFYEFLPIRTRYELDEIRDDQAMARGEAEYNTTIKFSPYSEELDNDDNNRTKLIAANQKPYWQRGMFRLKHWDEQEERLYLITLSIDNSSVRFLHDIAAETLDYQYKAQNSTETVGETIRLNIKDSSWREIPGQVTKAADGKLSRERGGQWLQGRELKNAEDTQKFVESQHAILNHLSFVDRTLVSQHPTFEGYLNAFHNELYDQAALLDGLLQRAAGVFRGDVGVASATAGYIAREEGRVYDACGLILDGGNKVAGLAAKTGLESILGLAGRELKCTNRNCRKKVVVPLDDLRVGKLSCNKCGLVYDVCLKEARFDKSKIANQNTESVKPVKKESPWERIKREDQEDKEAKKRQRIAYAIKKKQVAERLAQAA